VQSIEPTFGLVLAGGQSRRMGQDKAALENDGEPQLDRAVRLLESLLPAVYVSARTEQETDPLRRKHKLIFDLQDDLGPVAGILAAFEFNPNVSWLVVACDLPNLDETTLRHLIKNTSTDHPVTAFSSEHDELPEPLCAVYRPQARDLVSTFVDEGLKCPRKMLINSPICLLKQPVPQALHNLNRPADVAGTAISQMKQPQ